MSEIDHLLFTELSYEQAAAVEGGLKLAITRIDCLKAGADGIFGGGDDVYVKVDGQVLFGILDSFKSGTSKLTADPRFLFKNSGSSATVDLFDSDFPSQDDFLGGFTARSTGGKVVSKRVSGSGSEYRIFYRAA